jgi:F0F1-type ATP synthase alpha subunit
MKEIIGEINERSSEVKVRLEKNINTSLLIERNQENLSGKIDGMSKTLQNNKTTSQESQKEVKVMITEQTIIMENIEQNLRQLMQETEENKIEEKIIEVSGNVEATYNNTNLRFDEMNDSLVNIANGIQILINNGEISRNEVQEYINQLVQVMQNKVNENKEVVEQGKSLFLSIHKDISGRIVNVKGYMLGGNQALREQISNNLSEVRNIVRNIKNE